MNILGSLGQIYMFVLLALLFLGTGFAIWGFLQFFGEKNKKKPNVGGGIPAGKPQDNLLKGENTTTMKKGGFIMGNNGWFKLAVFSFVGILISVAVLGLVSANGSSANNIHLQHQQQDQYQNAMGSMNNGMPMGNMSGNMQMQGGMSVNMPMQGYMPTQGNMPMDYNTMMMQQIYQMQMQMNQIQQQLNMMNGNTQMQGGMSSTPQSGSMSSMPSGGGMGMMNMGGMSSGGGGGMGMM
ncbi:hypothetical protein [Geosporobacter ferrireducens]|uniref:DUF4175 domain-containing protein n=1 Tax=Geosporobacter ferrireducens TaxID=1424294 RepID=A0A1D8GE28_9FIRM|nr:hypothetical protein [Geosporobacter ferrireducens]AOT69157.1 hypothetical protein Gferi_06025 [Geosporobacter ferrireducens]MTI56834.1 hypothetical protein [Geosporobacter ferrireducens]